MSKVRICMVCAGKGKVPSIGMVQKQCYDCAGTGKAYEDEEVGIKPIPKAKEVLKDYSEHDTWPNEETVSIPAIVKRKGRPPANVSRET